MLNPVPSTRGLQTHLRKQAATVKAVLSTPLGCKHPSHLSWLLPSHSCTLTAPELCPFPSQCTPSCPCTPHPKPQGPSHLCSATTSLVTLAKSLSPRALPQDPAAGIPPGKQHRARQSWTSPKHERKRAAQAQPHPPDCPRAAAWAQQKGSGQTPPVVPGSPIQGGALPASAHPNPRFAFPSRGFFLLPLENIKQIQAITGASHVAQVWERPKSIPGEMRMLESKERRGKASAWRQG